MRPRFWILLGTLAVVIGLTIIVKQRKAEAEARQRIFQQQAADRYATLEANAQHHEAITWKATRLWTLADTWYAAWTDAIMDSSQRWEAVEAGLEKWPTLEPLRSRCRADRMSGWTLERVTWKPFLDTTRQQPSADAALQFLLAHGQRRAILIARVNARWDLSPDTESEAGTPPVEWQLLALDRQEAESTFRLWYEATVALPAHTYFVDPLLYRESPQNCELLLVSAQRRFQLPHSESNPPPVWRPGAPLTGIPSDHAIAAAWADLNEDGRPDLWLAGRDGLWIAMGNPAGELDSPTLRWRSPEPLIFPESLAIADIDQDGDLDVWLTQYKNPYQLGQFPTPYYDANDGFRSYLLRNDAPAGFSDATRSSGLDAKRQRRTYSASWLDFDGDGHLDLVNISDFAGLDVYRNDGHGHFTETTATLGEHRHAFGMAHAVIDFNGDALPDLLMVGMDSPWAARLDALKLGRSDLPTYAQKRSAMTFGNRVLVGTPTGLQPEESSTAKSLAQAGWAWGVAELDVENDGRSDFFFANGHETRASQRDYERQFWLHDIYQASSTNDPGPELYFRAVATRRSAERASYGGWQNQALLRQAENHTFTESAWLSGAGLPADGRNVLAADFDHDGRVDLALTTVEGWPQVRQRLVIFRNETPNPGHWIGLRFREGSGRKSGVNTRVEITTKSGVHRRWLVTGAGYRSQQTVQAHFGLGAERDISTAAVVWPNGTRSTLTAPAIDRWHDAP